MSKRLLTMCFMLTAVAIGAHDSCPRVLRLLSPCAMNHDGKVDVADIVILVNILNGKKE